MNAIARTQTLFAQTSESSFHSIWRDLSDTFKKVHNVLEVTGREELGTYA